VHPTSVVGPTVFFQQILVTPPATATLTEIAATSTGTTHHGAVVTTLLTSTQWSTAVLAQTCNQALKVNVTPLILATLTETAAICTGTTHHGAVATTLNYSTQWSTAVLAQTCNQALKVNVTPLISATLTEIAATSTGTTHHGAVVKTLHNSTQ